MQHELNDTREEDGINGNGTGWYLYLNLNEYSNNFKIKTML